VAVDREAERERQGAKLKAIVNRVDRSLRQATQRLAQTTNVRGVINDMLRESSTILDVHGVIECGLLLYDSVSRLLHFEALFSNGQETNLAGTALEGPFPVDSEPLALPWLRIQQEPWLWGLTDDSSILATTARAWHESKGTRSVAYLPLRRGQDCVGFVGFSLRSVHPPTPQEVDLLQSVGSQVALAVEVQRLATANEQASVAREHQRLADLRSIELTKANAALQATIDAVTNMQSLDDFMPRVMAIVAAAFEAVGAGYFEHRGGTIYHRFWLQDERLLTATELPDLDPVHLPVLELLARGFSVPTEHLGVEFHERLRPSIVHHRSATASPAMHALCVSRGWDRELNIPLFANDRTEAAITFFRHEQHPFTEADISLAESLAKQISLARQVNRLGEREREVTVAHERETIAQKRAVELARSNQALQSTIDVLASVDSLTEFVPSVLRLVSTAFESAGCAYYEHLIGEPIFLRYWLWQGGLLGPKELLLPRDDDRGFLQVLARGFHLAMNGTQDRLRQGHTPVVIDHEEPAFDETDIDRFYMAHGLPLELRVPLVVSGNPDGSLVIRRSASQPFNESEIALAGNLGKQLALATQSHRLAERARIDSLTRAQEQAVVRERERMSRDIHDTLAQGYAAILVNAQAMKLSLRSELPPAALSGIEMFERLAKENLVHARRTMEDLRADPFERTALAVALQQCATEQTAPGIFSIECDIPTEELWVPRYIEVELRRIVKEALNNARRHARTGCAMLKLSTGEHRFTIRIIDRGVGFDSKKVEGSFGIRGMRERAGRAGADLDIQTSPGHGTIVTITIDMETSGDGSAPPAKVATSRHVAHPAKRGSWESPLES
jgi:signal transduction histidine kinase